MPEACINFGAIPPIFLPASRARALLRGILGWSAAAPAALVLNLVAPSLSFRHSGASNQIEDFALAFALLLIGGLGLAAAGWGGRWMLLASWPGQVGFVADGRGVSWRLGPFGSGRLDAARIEARYLFELDDEELEEDRFEAFLPEETQRRTMLPRLRHPQVRRCVRPLLLNFCGAPEEELAARLRPMIDAWRKTSAETGASPAAATRKEAGDGPPLKPPAPR
ncbi:MAG: hypothetical protein FLDDKLPJ_00703 [Phycisphaerae bacterium]|nr:hypothetical protein [Phycisphaerae bacterium]